MIAEQVGISEKCPINPNSTDQAQLREMVQTLQNWALLAA